MKITDDEFKKALVEAIRAIAHGGTGGPAGLEGLTMAFADVRPGSSTNVTSGLHAIADAIHSLVESVEYIAGNGIEVRVNIQSDEATQ
jgi:hypothetical protein